MHLPGVILAVIIILGAFAYGVKKKHPWAITLWTAAKLALRESNHGKAKNLKANRPGICIWREAKNQTCNCGHKRCPSVAKP